MFEPEYHQKITKMHFVKKGYFRKHVLFYRRKRIMPIKMSLHHTTFQNWNHNYKKISILQSLIKDQVQSSLHSVMENSPFGN